MVHIRNNLENIINPENNHFIDYDLLSINPHQVYKSKQEQKLAIFEISKGISCLIKEKHPGAFQYLCESFEETCSKLRKK